MNDRSEVAELHPDDVAENLRPAEETSQPQAQPTATPTPPTEEEAQLQNKANKTPWEQRRLATLTRQRHEAERRAQLAEQRAAQAEARLAALSGDTGGQQQGQQPSTDALQQQFNSAVEQEAAKRAFDAACNDLYTKGTEQFSDFTTKIQSFQHIGGLPPLVVEAALEIGDAHEVLHALAGDLDEASRIFELSPLRMAAALTKFAEQAKAAKRKVPSRAPDPITPVQGSVTPAEKSPEEMSPKEWRAWREAQLEKRKKR